MGIATGRLPSLDQKIEALVGDIRNLPTPPLVLAQINRVISDDSTSAYDIAGILAEDPAMSAKVLKLSNSAFYGLPKSVPTVKQAIVILGMTEVKNVVLSAAMFAAFPGRPEDREYHDDFWRHSLAVAVAARMLIRTRQIRQLLEAETAFSAGLLHDVGKMVILCYAPAAHHEIRQLQSRRSVPDLIAETEVMGVDHTQVGAFLAQRWKLPHEIMEAIVFHHAPQENEDVPLYAAVANVANSLAHMTFDPREGAAGHFPPDPRSISYLGVDWDEIDQLKSRLVEEYTKSETFLRMALG